jgi:type IV pilus assembly protein PilV
MKGLQAMQGVSLVEAMVAVLIFGVGLIGVASMQINGLRFNRDAFLRSQATVLAYEVIEQMRIDRGRAVDDSVYSASYGAAAGDVVCNAASSAAASVKACWQVYLRDQLPSGALVVSSPSGADGNAFTVTITWSDSWKAKADSQPNAKSRQAVVFQL